MNAKIEKFEKDNLNSYQQKSNLKNNSRDNINIIIPCEESNKKLKKISETKNPKNKIQNGKNEKKEINQEKNLDNNKLLKA